MDSILLISTGGTFNKIYNPLNGELEIDSKSLATQKILKHWLCSYPIKTIIHKDSLDFTPNDREELKNYIIQSNYKKIVIIHGTDTMHLSAKVVANTNLQKQIVFTGAMVPFSINPIEATANLAAAIGFLQSTNTLGTYICMNGKVDEYFKIQKDRKLGLFVKTK